MNSKVQSNYFRLWIFLLISIAVSFMGIFLIPSISYSNSMGNVTTLTIGITSFIAICVALWFLISFFRYKSQDKIIEKYGASVGRMLLLILIFLTSVIVISLIFGVISLLIYNTTKNTMSFEQVKLIVNYIVSFSVIGLYPFYISIFWNVIYSDKKISRAIVSGLKVGWRRYLMLLALVGCNFVAGVLITMAFHNIPSNVFIEIVKIAIYSALGLVVLYLSECIYFKNTSNKNVENY